MQRLFLHSELRSRHYWRMPVDCISWPADQHRDIYINNNFKWMAFGMGHVDIHGDQRCSNHGYSYEWLELYSQLTDFVLLTFLIIHTCVLPSKTFECLYWLAAARYQRFCAEFTLFLMMKFVCVSFSWCSTPYFVTLSSPAISLVFLRGDRLRMRERR